MRESNTAGKVSTCQPSEFEDLPLLNLGAGYVLCPGRHMLQDKSLTRTSSFAAVSLTDTADPP